jgi:protein TonB
MFEEAYQQGRGFSFKRWSVSIFLAVFFYLVLFYAVSILRGTSALLPEENTKQVDVDFVEEVVKPEEPKPAPVVPKDMKVVEVAQPIVQEILAPIVIPDAAPKEADPGKDKGVAVYGKYDPGKVDPLGQEGGKVEAPPAPEPVRLPEDAMAPQPIADNPIPKYPSEARNKGLTGMVILKIIIDAQGNVGKVEVMKGEEPFTSAAVEAVKKWKYKPAYYQDKPITVYHIVKIPFTLKA